MKVIPKYAFELSQREAAPTTWDVKVFVCRPLTDVLARYEGVVRFTSSEQKMDELIDDLSGIVVSVPDCFEAREVVKRRVTIGKGF